MRHWIQTLLIVLCVWVSWRPLPCVNGYTYLYPSVTTCFPVERYREYHICSPKLRSLRVGCPVLLNYQWWRVNERHGDVVMLRRW